MRPHHTPTAQNAPSPSLETQPALGAVLLFLVAGCGTREPSGGTLTGQIPAFGGAAASGSTTNTTQGQQAGTVTAYAGAFHNVPVAGDPGSFRPTATGPKVATQQVPQGRNFTFHLPAGTYVLDSYSESLGYCDAGPVSVMAGRTVTENITCAGK